MVTASVQRMMDSIVSKAMQDGTLAEGVHPEPFIGVYRPIAGWKAVMMWYNPEGFFEPWDTSAFAFTTREEAERYAREWAAIEQVEVNFEAQI